MKIASKITLEVQIKDRKFVSNQNIINDILDAYNGHIINITFGKRANKRSDKQNGYYWSVIIPIFRNSIREEWGEIWDISEMHEFLKSNCNYDEFVNTDTGEIIRKVRSTTENTTKTQEDFHEKCRALCSTFFNTEIPLPNKDLKIEF
jgi:hypothetical protein